MLSKSKIKWITLIIVIFVVGVALGFLGGQTYQRKIMQQWRRGRPNLPQRFLSNLQKQLKLSDEQVRKIDEILKNSRKRFQAINEPIREKEKEIRKGVMMEIESVLTPEQKVQYSQLREKWEKEREKRWGQDTTVTSQDTINKKEK